MEDPSSDVTLVLDEGRGWEACTSYEHFRVHGNVSGQSGPVGLEQGGCRVDSWSAVEVERDDRAEIMAYATLLEGSTYTGAINAARPER
jgi:hypothetical protein